jgi:cytosine deaminase
VASSLAQIATIANAKLADGRVVDVHVAEGRIASVVDAQPVAVESPDDGRLDLDGWLLLPAMAEPHAHLDKALTADLVPNPAGDLGGAIDAWITANQAGQLPYESTVERATTALEMLLVNGVTAVRSHVDVGASIGATGVHAIHEARGRLAGLLDVQTVALVHVPVTGDNGDGNRGALDIAVEAGVDLLGGCPHLDPDGAVMIDHVLSAATAAGLPIDFHVDETLDPAMLMLPEVARQVISAGFEHPVAASHCVSLGMQTPAVQAEVAAVVAEAGVAVFALPQTNLFLQARQIATAPPRGLTAFDALLEAGVVVGAGGDNVQDPFNLVGRSDPLETAALLVMAGHRSPETAYDMVSNAPRQAMGLEPVRFQPGDPADFVAVDAATLREAIADAPGARKTFFGGQLVASARRETEIHR